MQPITPSGDRPAHLQRASGLLATTQLEKGPEVNCANPKCRVGDEYVKGGTLQFVELELSPEERLANADAGFPVCVAPARYFWLCQRCSQSIAIKRWTADGLELEPLSFGRVRSLNLDLLGTRVGPKRSLTETNRLLEMLA